MATPSAVLPANGASPAAPQQSVAPSPARQIVFPPLQGSQLVLGTFALSLATFMNVLDTSIANVSIPAISGDLGVSPAQGTWVITSFAVANAISLPLTGWLTQRLGQVRLFTASVLLFVIASWLCGLAPNIESLIAFRVLQGFVAGPMIPLSQTLLLALGVALWGVQMGITQGLLAAMVADTAPAELRGSAYGFFNLLSGLALLVSSAVAGALWQTLGPAFTFYVGAGFAALAMLALAAYGPGR